MSNNLVISAWGSISAVGSNLQEVENSYQSSSHCLAKNGAGFWGGYLGEEAEKEIEKLIASHPKYKLLDRSAILAIYASLQAWKKRIKLGECPLGKGGVNIGSSRGATQILEKRLKDYYKDDNQLPTPHTSPTTTLGAVSSWVGKALNLIGPAFSHSVTCSTSLYSIGNAAAWVGSGMVDFFIAGGTETPLTQFTIDQMRALGIYSDLDSPYPCAPLGTKSIGQNTMVLGEGAASFVIEQREKAVARGINRYYNIAGLGFANENISSPTSISADGKALQLAMKSALKQAKMETVDLVLMHAPGTLKGDEAELKAIDRVFDTLPRLTSFKWKTGHLLGASTAIAIEQAILLLENKMKPNLPYSSLVMPEIKGISSVMINSIGFGGNAGSIILTKNN